MSFSKRQEKVNLDKIHHYYVSTKRCIKNLIGLSTTTDKIKLDVARLRHILEMLDYVIKEK
jgi:hypothetical protein